MLSSISTFTDDAAGLEKTLRLLQYLSQTTAALLPAESARPWLQAQAQLALGRRYFRLLKWHGSWTTAYRQLESDQGALAKLLAVLKWSFLGLYFFLEVFTITNVMRVTNYSWGPAVQNEANKCWLYSIVASILLSVYRILALQFTTNVEEGGKAGTTPEVKEDREKKEAVPVQNANSDVYSALLLQLTIDCADVVIPAVATGWLALDQVYVGVGGTVSSVVAGQQLWLKVQSKRASS